MGRDGALLYKTKDELVQALSALPQSVLAMRPTRRFALRQGDGQAAVTSDFFRDPAAPRLPTSFGDDRVLLFPRDAQSVYVSWDLKPSRFASDAWTLVVSDVETGRVLAAEPIGRSWGAKFVVVGGAGRARVAGLRKGPVAVDGPIDPASFELRSSSVDVPRGVAEAGAVEPGEPTDWPTSA